MFINTIYAKLYLLYERMNSIAEDIAALLPDDLNFH